MGDENPIRTLGDYSKPSHEGYRNTIELPVGNNVVPLRSDTILLVQNGLSFYGLRSEDPNQHLKDFLKLVDPLDLDGENRERTRLCLFQFSICDQASNWLERLPEGSITTWEDLTTRFLAQFFPPGRTTKLRNDILMFQQHHGEYLSEASILKKKITKKEDVRGNFEIPCSIGGLKHVNALIDQGSDVNVMPYFTYMKLTNEMPAETDIRLSLASHSYIYPLRIAEDILVEVAEHVYLLDFMIFYIKENKKRPFILGTPFLTTAKAAIKFDKGTITLRSGKSKISFHRVPNSPGMTEKGVKNNIEPIAPTMTVNRLVLEWEEKIKLHLEREIEFNQ
ncbi:zinc finger, CCHC-type containing protein [Tanacetum coccineum]|uniref:Zinc finger, CCHC-type containing protein n=1 Tax=Tanacetum coccineum TaxID=301880 RepID=A0ABQ5GAY8_9ASTR